MRWQWLQALGTLFRPAGGAALWTPSWAASASQLGFGRASTSGEHVTTVTAGALPAVYRACSFIADSLASVELRIVQEQPDGGKVVVENSDASAALFDWSYEGREMFLYHAALGGNG